MTIYKGRLENEETGDVFYPQTSYDSKALSASQGAFLQKYKRGEFMIYIDKNIYKCIQDTNFSPTDYPQAWEKQQ